MIGDEPGNTRLYPKASEGALPQGEGWSRATVSSRGTSLKWPSAVCLAVKPVGEPDAGNRHVRFDERGGETERCHRAPPRLYFGRLNDPGPAKDNLLRPNN